MRFVAGRYLRNHLGRCLFAYENVASENSWILQFDIVNGPSDWSWLIWSDKMPEKRLMLAIHNRPSKEAAPPMTTSKELRGYFWQVKRAS